MSEKLQKLINHERSARSIGNRLEADAYRKKINELKRKEKAVRDSHKVSGAWQCSCGFHIELEIDASEFGEQLAEMHLAPHRKSGHLLRKLK